MERVIFIKKADAAILPTRAISVTSGCDLYSAEDAVLPSRAWKGIRTDLEVRLPHNHYGRIVLRSGIPLHKDIFIRDAVIDEDFQGDLIVVLYNHSENDLVITKGMRIAQLIVEKLIDPNIIVIDGTL
jgi:dUTP pyrophosphatase